MASSALYSRDRWIVAGALVIALVHQVDEAWIHPESGAAANLFITVVIGAALVWFYPRLPRIARGIIVTLIGLNAFVGGVFGHLVHYVNGTAQGSDPTGLAFVIAGTALLYVGIRTLARREIAPASA